MKILALIFFALLASLSFAAKQPQLFTFPDGLTLIENQLTVASVDPTPSETDSKPVPAVAEKAVVKNRVQKFVLPNGLRLLVQEDHRLPLVSMEASFRAGLLVAPLQQKVILFKEQSLVEKGLLGITSDNPDRAL